MAADCPFMTSDPDDQGVKVLAAITFY